MPGFNGTGPEGKGPLTGRKAGRCIPEKDAGIFGFFRGRRGGRGLGRRFQQGGNDKS